MGISSNGQGSKKEQRKGLYGDLSSVLFCGTSGGCRQIRLLVILLFVIVLLLKKEHKNRVNL